MTKAEAIRVLRSLIRELDFAKSDLNRAVEAQALYFELSLSFNPFSIVRPKDRGKLSGVRYYKDWANRLENYIIKTLKEAEDILSRSDLFDDAIDYTINEDAAGDVLIKRYVEDIKREAFDLYDKLCELDIFQKCGYWAALADRLLGIDENLQIFGDIVEPTPAGKDEPKETESTQDLNVDGIDISEDDAAVLNEVIIRLESAGLIESAGNVYKWKGTAALYGYMAHKVSTELDLTDTSGRIQWGLFTSIIPIYKLTYIKKQTSLIANGHLSKPINYEKINAIVKKLK